jgi:hypothetical protein
VVAEQEAAVVAQRPASGFGGNIIWIDPEHDIMLVWHLHGSGNAVDGMIQRIVASVGGPGA